MNVSPAKLHSNNWTFVRSLYILCTHLGIVATSNLFFYFFEFKLSTRSS